MFRWVSKGLGIAAFLAMLVLGTWMAAYPSPSDPKNLHYILWRHGLTSLDLDQACGTMVGDGGGNVRRVIIGMSKDQLTKRFGFLTPPSQAGPYYFRAYETISPGKDGLFLRRSPWLVLFHDGKATDLILVKGL